MRKGTYSAELFGYFLTVIRITHTKKSMRQIALVFGTPPESISQYEEGTRGVKEKYLDNLATAYEVNKYDLRNLWLACQGLMIIDHITPTFCSDASTQKRQIIFAAEKLGLDIKKIEPLGPIVRKRSKNAKTENIRDSISQLNEAERNRVMGYIDAIVENR